MKGVNDMAQTSWRSPMMAQANDVDTSNLLYSTPKNNTFNLSGANNNFSNQFAANTGNTAIDLSGVGTAGLSPGKVPYEASFMDNAFGFTNPDNGYKTGGWASPLLQTATAGMHAYLGLQQLNLMKDNLAFQKDAFSKQFENQRTTTNTQLSDRQNARNASGSGYESTDSYMKNHGV